MKMYLFFLDYLFKIVDTKIFMKLGNWKSIEYRDFLIK